MIVVLRIDLVIKLLLPAYLGSQLVFLYLLEPKLTLRECIFAHCKARKSTEPLGHSCQSYKYKTISKDMTVNQLLNRVNRKLMNGHTF